VNIKQRLEKLEAKLGRVAPTNMPERTLTDEEEADQMGAFLWFAVDSGKGAPNSILRAWHEAAESARQQGHTEYHVGLRPQAMAYWLHVKPEMLRHRRTHGVWVWDEPPLDMTVEEFAQLPVAEKVAVLRQPGRGHWSKETNRLA
jgi:hypothetical protein